MTDVCRIAEFGYRVCRDRWHRVDHKIRINNLEYRGRRSNAERGQLHVRCVELQRSTSSLSSNRNNDREVLCRCVYDTTEPARFVKSSLTLPRNVKTDLLVSNRLRSTFASQRLFHLEANEA